MRQADAQPDYRVTRTPSEHFFARLAEVADDPGTFATALGGVADVTAIHRDRLDGALARAGLGISEAVDRWMGERVIDEAAARELWHEGGAELRAGLLTNRWMSRELIEEWNGGGVPAGERAWANDVIERAWARLSTNAGQREDSLADDLREARGLRPKLGEVLAWRVIRSKPDDGTGLTTWRERVLGELAGLSLEEWPGAPRANVLADVIRYGATRERRMSTGSVLSHAVTRAQRVGEHTLRVWTERLDPMEGWGGWGDWHRPTPLDLSSAGEAIAVAAGWWDLLEHCTISDATFAGLIDQVREGNIPMEAALNTGIGGDRLGLVLATWREIRATTKESLHDGFLWRNLDTLRGEPELLGEMIEATGPAWRLLTLELDEETSWLWRYFDEAWVRGLSEGDAHEISEYTAALHAPDEVLAMLVTHVRGVAFAASGNIGGRVASVLAEEMSRRFGGDVRRAIALLNPATNLVELSAVMARL